MAAGAERTRASISPPVACVAKGGCSYLRALSTIEHLAGFDSTARSYAAAAARCQEEGCWAAARREEPSAQEVQIAAPVSLDGGNNAQSRGLCFSLRCLGAYPILAGEGCHLRWSGKLRRKACAQIR